MSSPIKPFQISIPDASLGALKDKLSAATFPDDDDIFGDWAYGAVRNDVKRLAERWRDGFDWRAQEQRLNELPQFTTDVDVEGFGALNVHFVHQRSSKPGSIPLLFCHGWPGSYLEVLKILPLLTEPKDGPSFHVVAPSLPNYGFSEGVGKKGFSIPQYAETMHKIMLKLGYDKYATQGGDWGFFITRLMGYLYPDHVVASHINYVLALKPPSASKHPLQFLKHSLLPYTQHERDGLARTRWFHKEGYGYNLEQSTRPSTLGLALADSPVALLAWIYEKLHDWTDGYPWTDDEVLTWVSVYHFSRAGPAASLRIYYETTHSQRDLVLKALEYNPRVPLGLSYFPKDLCVPPRTWGRTLGPVVLESVHPDGGHFAAHERPRELADDLRRMFGKGGGARKVRERFEAKL